MSALYNEIEPYAADWLVNLAREGHIAEGKVDRRSIADLQARDVEGFTQCHFFAGIGAWSYALRLAGWPDDVSVWTGSCPCQPFSTAGAGAGFADERHLWPVWFRLIEECRPPVVFGEQVASKAGLEWFDLVSSDLEGAGYAVGAADLGAASVGAPHIRQRLYFVAYTDGERLEGLGVQLRERRPLEAVLETRGSGEVGRLADSEGHGWVEGRRHIERRTRPGGRGQAGDMAHAETKRRGAGRIGEAHGRAALESDGHSDAVYWADADWVPCTDGTSRPVEPGTFPLAHGATARVGRLRAYGNAIVPQAAAEFIGAVMESLP